MNFTYGYKRSPPPPPHRPSNRCCHCQCRLLLSTLSALILSLYQEQTHFGLYFLYFIKALNSLTHFVLFLNQKKNKYIPPKNWNEGMPSFGSYFNFAICALQFTANLLKLSFRINFALVTFPWHSSQSIIYHLQSEFHMRVKITWDLQLLPQLGYG